MKNNNSSGSEIIVKEKCECCSSSMPDAVTLDIFESQIPTDRISIRISNVCPIHNTGQWEYLQPKLCQNPSCTNLNATNSCKNCGAYYCNVACQRSDWNDHKKYCVSIEYTYLVTYKKKTALSIFFKDMVLEGKTTTNKGIIMYWSYGDINDEDDSMKEGSAIMNSQNGSLKNCLFYLNGYIFKDMRPLGQTIRQIFGVEVISSDPDYETKCKNWTRFLAGKISSGTQIVPPKILLHFMKYGQNVGILIPKNHITCWNLARAAITIQVCHAHWVFNNTQEGLSVPDAYEKCMQELYKSQY